MLTVTERAGSLVPKCSKTGFSGPKHIQIIKNLPGFPPEIKFPTIRGILNGPRPPEGSYFRSNRFDTESAGSIPADGIHFSR